MKRVKLQDILSNNRHIDVKRLNKSMGLLKQLRAIGTSGPGYRLATAFDQRRVSVSHPKNSADSRTIVLPQHSL